MTGIADRLLGGVRARKADAFARAYVKEHEGLREAIEYANTASQSSGTGIKDYVAIFETIRRRKPRVVLECGTGKSTMVIAQAMLENAGGRPAGDMKFISMEHNRQWYEQQVPLIPGKFRSFVEIHHSPMDTWGYSLLRGTCYKEIPEYPYEFVFVDGPHQGFDGQAPMCNIDFLRVVAGSETPVSALVDNRKHTVLAFTLAFGPKKVRYHSAWSVGTVRPVTKHDLLLHDKNVMKGKGGIFGGVVNTTNAFPFPEN